LLGLPPDFPGPPAGHFPASDWQPVCLRVGLMTVNLLRVNVLVICAAILQANATPTLGDLMVSSPSEQSTAMPDFRQDDESVVRVVLDRVIFPELAKFGNRVPAAMLLVEDQTISLGATGKIPTHWQMFLEPNPSNGWPGLIADNARRQRLVDSFELRNARRHDLPNVHRSDLIRVADGRFAEVRDKYRDRPLGTARLSLPGYSLDGYALIGASYDCGALCGVAWLIVLDNTSGSWRVANASPLGIS